VAKMLTIVMSQCLRDDYVEDLNTQAENKEGCNLHGRIEVYSLLSARQYEVICPRFCHLRGAVVWCGNRCRRWLGTFILASAATSSKPHFMSTICSRSATSPLTSHTRSVAVPAAPRSSPPHDGQCTRSRFGICCAVQCYLADTEMNWGRGQVNHLAFGDEYPGKTDPLDGQVGFLAPAVASHEHCAASQQDITRV
jgi:hypothetical protein